MTFTDAIDVLGKSIDVVGVAVITLGGIAALTHHLGGLLRSRSSGPEQASSDARMVAYREMRQRLGRSILLGLEFLVAADIIRTVAIAPSIENVVILAGIVAVRTFLSFSLEVELESRLPWRKEKGSGAPGGS